MSEVLFGLDLGGTNIKSIAIDQDGLELGHASLPTRDLTGETPWKEGVHQALRQLEVRFGPAKFIGLCAPGLARSDNRAVASMPGRLQGLENLDWSAFLDRPVYVANDAHAAMAAEAWIGAAAGLRHAFMLTLGTGVGGAILADGRVLQGAMGRAGHLGHICLNVEGTPDITRIPGSIEDMFGDCTIVERSAGRFRCTADLVRAYEAGDEFAAVIWTRSIRALGCAIASLINVLDPQAVILGGGIATAGESLLGPLAQVLDEVEWRPSGHRVPILPAQLGDYSGAIGAARMASLAL